MNVVNFHHKLLLFLADLFLFYLFQLVMLISTNKKQDLGQRIEVNKLFQCLDIFAQT